MLYHFNTFNENNVFLNSNTYILSKRNTNYHFDVYSTLKIRYKALL